MQGQLLLTSITNTPASKPGLQGAIDSWLCLSLEFYQSQGGASVQGLVSEALNSETGRGGFWSELDLCFMSRLGGMCLACSIPDLSKKTQTDQRTLSLSLNYFIVS